MDSIFTKLILSVASILGLVSAPAYIQLSATSIVFDYKTGESMPLYYLNVKNIGPQRERFDVSVNVPWIFFSREGFDSVTSLYLERESAVNFVLDIRPEMVADGSHSGEITVQAADVYDYSVIDTKTVKVTLNKNFVPTPIPSETATPTPSPSIIASSTPSLTPTLTAFPVVSPTPTPTPTPTRTPSRLPLFSPTPKKTLPSVATPIISPTIPTIPAVSPTPSISATLLPLPKPTVGTYPLRTKTLFEDLWQFLKDTFWPF